MGLIDSCTFKGKKKVKSLLRVFLLSCEIRESIILDSKKYYLNTVAILLSGVITWQVCNNTCPVFKLVKA